MAPDLDPSAPAPAGGVPHAPVVEVRGVSKRFGRIQACDAVDLTLESGRIHGLLGQNGAGKSTLAKMLVGLYSPDDGEIRVRGERVVIRNLAESIELGIGMVHQHFSLIEPLTVWENVTLGERGRPEPKAISSQIEELGTRYGLDVDPSALIEDLTVGQRQRVEILKTLRRDPSVLILDEPTSSLTLAESHELFEVLRKVVRTEGRTVVLISHKLDEILHATDDVTIMRNGAVVASLQTGETDAPELAREMVGRPVSLRSESAALGLLDATAVATDTAGVVIDDAEPMLRVVDAVAHDNEGRPLLSGLSLDVRAGEIVGLAGVEGNGQRALGDLLAGILDLDSGDVFVDGEHINASRPGAMNRAGVGIITEDRHHSGSVLAMSVAENLVLGHLGQVMDHRLLSKRKLRKLARERIEQFDVHTASEDAPFWSLSGGNQQRVVLARELSANPKVLVAAQPTRGLDVGAIEYMSERLRACAEDGMAVLLISTELEEILDLSHRVAVIHRGRITGVADRAGLDPERLGLLMGGEAA